MLKKWFLKYKLKQEIKKAERTEKVLLLLVLDGTWKKEDKFFKQMFFENKDKLNELKHCFNLL